MIVSLGTREAAERLGVSQTTLKRWVSHFPDAFPKDRLGHYMFTEKEMEWLEKIKEDVRSGLPIESVKLPGRHVEPAPVPPGESLWSGENRDSDGSPESLLLRLQQLERKVDQKADEVVTAQIYQHRLELEELRQMIRQVAAAVESMRQTAAGLDAEPVPRQAPPAPRTHEKRPARAPKRRVFWLF